MKYIIYLFLILSNLAHAERLICDDDLDARNASTYIQYERKGDKFIWSNNVTSTTKSMTILHENEKRLHLVDSNTFDVVNVFIFNKETNRYNFINTWLDMEPIVWKGNCKVVK